MTHPNSPYAVMMTECEINAAKAKFIHEVVHDKHDSLILDGFLLECEAELLNLVKSVLGNQSFGKISSDIIALKDNLNAQVYSYVDEHMERFDVS